MMQCGDKGIRGNDTNQKTYGYMAELLRRRNDGTDFLGLMFHVSMTAGLVVFHRRHGMAIENSAPDTYRGRKSGTKAIVRAKGGQGPGPFSPLCSSPSTSLTSAPGEGRFSAISDGRSPGKTPSLRGDSRAKDEEDSHERSQKPTKRDFGSSSVFVYFRALLWPFPLCSSRADGGISPSREHNQPIDG